MSFVAATGPHVSLVAEPILRIGPLSITNSTILGGFGLVLLLGMLLWVRYHARRQAYDRLTVAILWGYGALLDTVEDVVGDRAKARQLAPLAISMFFVLIINNWLGLLPIVGTVSSHGQPLFRGLAADLNFTLALAIITMVVAQLWAIKQVGFLGHLRTYVVNPLRDPVGAMMGGMEIMAQFTRLIALAMRLFGNIFAGEVLLLVIGYLSQWTAPLSLPMFMGLELFVGAIQAYVFFMLSVVFISLGQSQADEENKAPSSLTRAAVAAR